MECELFTQEMKDNFMDKLNQFIMEVYQLRVSERKVALVQ